MAFGYPVLLELTGRPAVVIGEAAVEAGKVEGLLAAGAEVTVIAKGPQSALDRLATDPRVVVHRRGYRGPADLDGAVLCVAHASEPGVRSAIAADARAAGVLVNVMDDVPNCDFAAPAVVRRGDLLIAIGTGGRAPALASRLRVELGERFGPDWAQLVDLVGQVRAATLPHLPDFADRSRRWKAALDLDELERLIRVGQGDLAATRLRDRLLKDVRARDRVVEGVPGRDRVVEDLPARDRLPGELPQACGRPDAPQAPGRLGSPTGGPGIGAGGSSTGPDGTGAGRPGPGGAS